MVQLQPHQIIFVAGLMLLLLPLPFFFSCPLRLPPPSSPLLTSPDWQRVFFSPELLFSLLGGGATQIAKQGAICRLVTLVFSCTSSAVASGLVGQVNSVPMPCLVKCWVIYHRNVVRNTLCFGTTRTNVVEGGKKTVW
jgi:hypothetical protein